MRKPNEILDRPYSDHGAYRVPEGYFNTLGQRIMAAVDAEEKAAANATKKQTKGRLILMPRIRHAAAACLTALLVGMGTLAYFAYDSDSTAMTAESSQTSETDEYVKECMDYAMLDNNDVYMYVANQQ